MLALQTVSGPLLVVPRPGQVSPGGGRFPSRDPPASSSQRRAALRSKVTTGRRERRGEESCRRAPRGKCRVLARPVTGIYWSLGAGTELYRWEQGKLYSFHSQHISHLGFTIALISRPDCLGPIIMSEECCETSELSSWPGY